MIQKQVSYLVLLLESFVPKTAKFREFASSATASERHPDQRNPKKLRAILSQEDSALIDIKDCPYFLLI